MLNTFSLSQPLKERNAGWAVFVKGFLFNLLLYFHNHIVTYIPSHLIRSFFLRSFIRIKLGHGCSTLLGLRLYTRGGVEIGCHSVIDRDCVLDGRGSIKIGQNVNLAPEVMILTAYHDPDDGEDFGGGHKSVVIDDYAWIATRALIMPGVKIGKGAVVGAGSVVTKDVEPQTIVAGNPARVIRKRKGEQSYQLDYRRIFH